MPTYKLIYFPARGRAELTRLILSSAGKEFEDERRTAENWMEIKSKMPYEQLPVLMVGDKMMNQSGAIQKYLSREFGLYGSNNVENTECDIVMETARDLHEELVKYFFEKAEAPKAEIAAKLKETTIPKFLKFIEKLLKESSKTFLVGKKLTVADLAYLDQADRITSLFGDAVLKDFPDASEHYKKIKAIPNIKKWLEKRPKTDF